MIRRGFTNADYNNANTKKLMEKFEKILKLSMKGDLDLKNRIDSFSSVLLLDPFA